MTQVNHIGELPGESCGTLTGDASPVPFSTEGSSSMGKQGTEIKTDIDQILDTI